MIESKFNKAYLQIIKEDYDGFLPKENEVSATAETEEVPASDALKQVTFVTSDKALIDAINSGFEEVVVLVNAKDETTGETWLDYYNSQVERLRNELKELYEY